MTRALIFSLNCLKQTTKHLKPANFTDSIIYEDDNYLVINKWPGISTLSDRHQEVCLLDQARRYQIDIQVCHRLDKDTSGVLVFAKNQDAYRFLSMQFQNRSVEKVYHAIVEGRHQFSNEIVSLPLYAGRRGHVRVSHVAGKESETMLDTIDQFKLHTLVQCKPTTGRLHQIRVHLSVLDAPIVGDLSYGGHELFLSNLKRHYNLNKDTLERALMARPALHAQSIKFQISENNSEVFEAAYPKDFKVTIKQLDKYRTYSHG